MRLHISHDLAGTLALARRLEHNPNSPFSFSKEKERERTEGSRGRVSSRLATTFGSKGLFELLVRSSRTDCLITGNSVKALCCLCEGKKRSNDKKMQTDRLTDRDEWMLCVSLVK